MVWLDMHRVSEKCYCYVSLKGFFFFWGGDVLMFAGEWLGGGLREYLEEMGQEGRVVWFWMYVCSKR